MVLFCVNILPESKQNLLFVLLCLFPSFSSAVTARRQQSVQQPATTTQETMMNSPWRTSCKQHHNPCNNTARNNDTQSMTYIKQQIATHATTRQPRNHDTQSITYIKQQITIPDAHQATVDNPCNDKKRDRINSWRTSSNKSNSMKCDRKTPHKKTHAHETSYIISQKNVVCL